MQRFSRLTGTVRLIGLAYVMASIVVVMSERVFWFWSPSVVVHLELAAYYALATVAAILVIGRFRVGSVASLLLVAPILAFVVEGVLTPIIYTGGPLIPLFPAWFTWWHGVMSFIFLVFTVRGWLLNRQTGRILGAAVAIGGFWGVWASTLRLPENVGDEELIAEMGALVVLEPMAFARYAALFTAFLAGSHLVLGFVWPERAELHPVAERVVGGLVAVAVVGWTVVVPVALPTFILYVGAQWLGLRWHRQAALPQTSGGPVEPDIFQKLQGRVHPRAVLPLLTISPVASLTYAGLWLVDPSDLTLRIIMYGTIAVQAPAGGIAVVWALWHARRHRQPKAAAGPLAVGLEAASGQEVDDHR